MDGDDKTPATTAMMRNRTVRLLRGWVRSSVLRQTRLHRVEGLEGISKFETISYQESLTQDKKLRRYFIGQSCKGKVIWLTQGQKREAWTREGGVTNLNSYFQK